MMTDLQTAEIRDSLRMQADIAAAVAARQERQARANTCLSAPGRLDWPPAYADPFPALSGVVPEIEAADLTVDVMGGAVAHHGLLLVRGLFSQQRVADIRAMQDRIKEASQRGQADTDGWYMPYVGGGKSEKALRRRTEGAGGNWLVDSPLGLARILEHLESVGLVRLIGEHFQERPVISMQKSVLRTIHPSPGPTGWHQDGSFLGDEVRAMNVWVALTPCGGAFPASGLELIPRRIEEIFSIDRSLGRVSISFELVEQLKRECPSVNPEFAAGDVLIFDEHLLHRTSLEPGLTQVRHALECWFFAPSHASEKYALLQV